ncbi:MAG: hypothetical protein WA191_06825 [Telluria sp.]
MSKKQKDAPDAEFTAQPDPQMGSDVTAIDSPPTYVVDMIRPEDRSAEPIIAQVASADVDHWKSHGWIVKE